MMLEIAVLAGLSLVQWAIYTFLLWVMIKIQKMQYNLPGLLGSSALATLIGHIPVVGAYLSWAVLVFCLWKVTREDIVPDVVFTVGVAGAIMFCLNLWVFAALLGHLRPSCEPNLAEDPPAFEMAGFTESDEPPGEPEPEPEPAPPPPARVAESTAQKRPLAAAVAAAASLISGNKAASKPPGPSAAALGLALKGVVLHSTKPSAMILAANRLHTLAVGDDIAFNAPQGRVTIRCVSIDKSGVGLLLNETDTVTLRVR